jgi:hypothetical protein
MSPDPDGPTSDPGPTTLEQALDALEHDTDTALRVLAAATQEARRLKTAASAGQLRDVHQAVEAVDRAAASAAAAASELRAGWRFDVSGYFESGGYAKELLAAAADAGAHAVESDQRILCYPSIVAVSPSDATVVVDKKKQRRVRPSMVARQLAQLQARPPKFKPETFLETLVAAYDLVAPRPGATVKLVSVYGVLTLLPGAGREYTKPEFARDLYLLDQSGITATRSGRVMSLPASALTRGSGVLTTVTRGGQVKVYAGVSFGEPQATHGGTPVGAP